MFLAAGILVVGDNSVIAFTLSLIGKILFSDTKCPKYLILL